MKQNIKRLWLMVCVAFSLLALSACSAADIEAEELNEQQSELLCDITEEILVECTKIPADEIEKKEALAVKYKDSVGAALYSSWKGVMNDTGAFAEVVSRTARITEDGGYECIIEASFANRMVTFKAFYESGANGVPVPASYSFTPEYSTGEKLAKAGMNTLMGMGTVFMVLIFISLIISCFKFINNFENRARAAAPQTTPAPAPAPVPAAAEEEENLADDLELVAVITAAIAAFGNTSADGLVVRSIKRAPGAKWKRA